MELEKTRTPLRDTLGVTIEQVTTSHAGAIVDTFYVVKTPGNHEGSTYYSKAEADAAYMAAVANAA